MTPREDAVWAQAQEGEFNFHATEGGIWRISPDFEKNTERLLKGFQFNADDFDGKVILDLGAGSKLRSKFFKKARIIAIEPLANRFLSALTWSDLGDAWQVYSEPAENMILELQEQVQFVMCVNVLDHCSNPRQVLANACKYLTDSGTMLLSTDLHAYPDQEHPVALSSELIDRWCREAGLYVVQKYLALPVGMAYGSGLAYTVLLSRDETSQVTVRIFTKSIIIGVITSFPKALVRFISHSVKYPVQALTAILSWL